MERRGSTRNKIMGEKCLSNVLNEVSEVRIATNEWGMEIQRVFLELFRKPLPIYTRHRAKRE